MADKKVAAFLLKTWSTHDLAEEIIIYHKRLNELGALVHQSINVFRESALIRSTYTLYLRYLEAVIFFELLNTSTLYGDRCREW